MELATSSKVDSGFEAHCGKILMALQLGFPVYLANGASAGKGFALDTTLRVQGGRRFWINVECRHSPNGALGSESLLARDLWSRADRADLLLILTNAPVTAGVGDWIRQTRAERTFPIVIWTGEYLDHLTHDLLEGKASGAEREELITRVHATLVSEIKHYDPDRRTAHYDPRLELPYSIPPLDPSTPFVDREDEFAQLSRLDTYCSAFLTGPPGIGKSCLARKLLGIANRHGLTPVIIAVRQSGPDPCESFVIGVARALRHVGAPALLLDALQQFGVANIGNMFDVVISALQENGLLILLEDYHNVPEQSHLGALIHEYLHNPGRSKLLITSRHQIPSAYQRLGTSSIHIPLHGLDAESIHSYFESLHVMVGKRLVSELVRRHDGWPIVVAEIGTQLRTARGRTGKAISLARLTGETIFPAIVTEVLSTLTSSTQRLLSYVLSMQVPVSSSELMVVSGLGEERFTASWSELDRAGVVRANMELLNSVHDLLRVPLHDFLVGSRIEEDWGTYLSCNRENPDRIAAAVEHFLRVPKIERAAEVLLSGSDLLMRKGMFTTLLRLMQSFPPEAVAEIQYLHLLLQRCKALEGLGRVGEAFDTLVASFPTALVDVPQEILPQYAYTRARVLYHLGKYPDALHMLEAVLESRSTWGGEELQQLAQVLALKGRLQFVTRDLVQAERDYNEALNTYELLQNEYGCNKIRHRLAMIKLKRQQYLEAERDFRVVELTSRRLGDMKRLSYALHRRGEIRAHFGDFAQARTFLKESIAIKKRMGHLRGLVYSYAELGRVATLQGDGEEAAHDMEQAFALVLKLDMPKEEAFVSSMMAFVRLRLGNRDEAENWISRARRIYLELGLTKRADEATLDSIEKSAPDLLN